MTSNKVKSYTNVIVSNIWPIENKELKKFIPMALMFWSILFVFNLLRSTKDALLVANVGAEAISFVKVYAVVPASILFMLIYAKMTSVVNQHRIFYTFCSIFLSFFLLFALVFYPAKDFFHPDAQKIELLISRSFSIFGLYELHMNHFQWFLRCYAKWTYTLFYIFSELWISMMLSLLFFRFANGITKTDEAKRFYPMIGFFGNLGLIAGGYLLMALTHQNADAKLKLDASTEYTVLVSASLVVCAAIVFLMAVYAYMNKVVLSDPRFVPATVAKKKEKLELSVLDGFKIVFSSKYLGLLALMVLIYGMSINLVEGPWKDAAKKAYPSTVAYMGFMGRLQICTGAATMLAYLISAQFLKRVSWFVGAMFTPVVLSLSGLGFFLFLMVDKTAGSTASAWFEFLSMTPLQLAVMCGFLQNVAVKSTKYSFFDPAKEMAYIPIDVELQTKGKAAVDLVGHRFGKSMGGVVLSTIFLIFPNVGFVGIAPYLMAIFVVLSLIWFVDVRLLYNEYRKFVKE